MKNIYLDKAQKNTTIHILTIIYIKVIKINRRQCSLFSDWLHPGGVRTFLLSNWSSCLLWKRVLIADWTNAAEGRTQLVEGRDAEGGQRRGVQNAELTHPLRPNRTEYGVHREQKWVFGKLSHTRAKWIGPAGREMGSTACRCSRARGVILARWEFKPVLYVSRRRRYLPASAHTEDWADYQPRVSLDSPGQHGHGAVAFAS